METVFEDWKKALSDLRSSVEKDLKEVRQHKMEVQKMREQMESEFSVGRVIRDDHRLIISAPEIIIGNVDAAGELKSDSLCTIVLKGNSVKLHGVGSGGEISCNASSIIQKAVNPGNDGMEEVVEPVSRIISQAKSVVVQANQEEDVFTSLPDMTTGGVTIHADTSLLLNASIESETRKIRLENTISGLEKSKSQVQSQADSIKKLFESMLKDMQELIEKHDSLLQNEIEARANLGDVFELNDKRRTLTSSLYDAFCEYSRSLSELAEFTRQISILKKQKDEVPDSTKYKEETTGATVRIEGEVINIISKDGEGNLRNNPESGITVEGQSIAIVSLDEEGALDKDGNIQIKAMNVALSTNDSKNIDFDDNGDYTKGDFESAGEILIQSKNISLESVDYEVKDKKITEKSLSKEGKLSMRFENIELSTNDTEGKAAGAMSVNSKNITLKSMDLDKDSRKDKAITPGSSMLLLSEKMFVGSKDKDTESKLVQTSAETIGTFAKTTYEVQQGEKKAVLQMDGGKMELSGDSTGIYGKTTINAATEIKGELKAPKASIDSVEAKSSFKSPNISDGMAAGGGGGGGSLSAKLTKEDAQKEESKK